MKIKVQYLKQSRAQTVIMQQADVYDTHLLTIGRSTDQNIFLSDAAVSLKHACIHCQNADSIFIESLSPVGMRVNDKLIEKTILKSGDKIRIASFIITVFPPDDSHELVLFVEELMVEETSTDDFAETQYVGTASEDVQLEKVSRSRLPINLSQTRLKKRPWAWFAMIFVFGFFLGLPLFGIQLSQQSKSDVGEDSGIINSWLPRIFPGDQMWNSGPISHVHEFFGHECNSCHQQPFVMVANQVCMDCHNDTHAHADRSKFDLLLVQNGRCGECHKEHNGLLTLKPAHQSLCSSCHHNLTESSSTTNLDNSSDFGFDHPEFKPKVLMTRVTNTENPVANWQRISLSSPDLKHESGLKFPHNKHLNPDGIEGPEGNAILECDTCHQPESGKAYFKPISMEKHCQSCHQLAFDPERPERVVPHGNLDQLKLFLDEFYALQALNGGYQDDAAPAIVKRRRRPNARINTNDQEKALRWAQNKSNDMAREVVEIRTCSVCHDITLATDSVAGWTIDPVFASSRWLSMARFDHDKHDGQACAECHAAQYSTLSTDVLIPGIKTCQACHGGEHAKNKYASSCIVCHQFHIDNKPAYGVAEETAMKKWSKDLKHESQSLMNKAKEMIGIKKK